MNEILRKIIPPQVRELVIELKTQIQNLINQKYKENDKHEDELRSFFGEYQLPQSYHELSAEQDIPDHYWVNIDEF